MAYYYQNPYLQQPQYPNPMSQQNSFANQQQNNSLVWVQGEAGAKSYLVAPNTTVLLMDSENQRFYLKSSDSSGMPQPLRIFEYTERTQSAQNAPLAQESIDLSSFATKAEFDAFKSEINALLKNVPQQVIKTKEANADG